MRKFFRSFEFVCLWLFGALIVRHFAPHASPLIYIAGGLPLPALGAMTQQAAQALATWDGGFWSTFAVVGSFTLTAAQMLSGSTTYLTLTGSAGAVNATTPTAIALAQQYQSAYGFPPTNGSTFQFEVQNTTNGTVTVVAGTGVTVNGTATIATTVNRTYLCTFTNVGTGPAFNGTTVTLQNVASRSN